MLKRWADVLNSCSFIGLKHMTTQAPIEILDQLGKLLNSQLRAVRIDDCLNSYMLILTAEESSFKDRCRMGSGMEYLVESDEI